MRALMPKSSAKRFLPVALATAFVTTSGHANAAGVSKNPHNSYQQSATKAARKHTPHAVVSDLKVTQDFAVATVKDPKGSPQAQAGNFAVFKVRKNHTMKQLAIGSSFSPLFLLELGMPRTTQTKLTWSGSVSSLNQYIADECEYQDGEDTPGYSGFGASFKPGGWQIDANSLFYIEKALSSVISPKNAKAKAGRRIICVDASYKHSDMVTSKKTNVTTWTLRLYFVAKRGLARTHKFRFSTSEDGGFTYYLDGRRIAG